MNTKVLKVRPDSKGRITLGSKLTQGVSSFKVTKNDKGIMLEPQIEIPEREAWLFKNKKALAQVRKGLENSASGKVKSRGNFTQYVDEEE